MQTSSLITLLKKQFPDWSTQNLVDVVNEVHKICLTSKPVAQMRLLGSGDNGDAVLTTVAGTRSYDIDTANGFSSDVWRITNVYLDDDNSDNTVKVTCVDATEGVSAKIVFDEDPGVATYNIRCYKQPTPILSDSIELQIPDQLVLGTFYVGVAAFIELTVNGNPDRWLQFLEKMLPKILFAMNDGLRGNTIQTPYKGY